ncbi:hypothetical protein B0T14DRAFT_583999 [Immersiella caudata]|uniref:Rhodopsin domain-containing protein n=1 Tax=Immersiella caudata TaxID=314043 RepID=A0AA39WNW5_9PEZI|nr:hypothetical protein B0T14DRAFT_583999 [Immersiella caudata]
MWAVSVLYFIGIRHAHHQLCPVQSARRSVGWCRGNVLGRWDRKIIVDYAIALGITSTVFDFYLTIYPTIVLWRLQMNTKKKFALSGASAATIYKCTTLPGLLTLQDFTYAVDDVVLLTNIEANFVLIDACIPTMFPLVEKLFGSNALGGDSSGYKKATDDTNPIVTIGSYPKKKRTKVTAVRRDH